LHSLSCDGDPVDQQTAWVALAERVFVIDRILDALVVLAKQQRNTNKLLRALGGK
jgi:hypothetical protein